MPVLPNILPSAKADLFQDNAANTLPEKNGGGQFAEWMSRALSPVPPAKSVASDVPEPVVATKADSFSSSAANKLSKTSDDDKSGFVDTAPGTSALATSAPVRIAVNLQPLQLVADIPVSGTQKKVKPDGKISDSGHSKTAENQAAVNQPASPENITAMSSPEILPAQIPVPALTEEALSLAVDNANIFQTVTPVSKNNSSAGGKTIALTPPLASLPSATLNLNSPVPAASDTALPINAPTELAAVFPELKNISAGTAKVSDADFSQNLSAAGDVSKIQTDSRKKNTAGTSVFPVVKAGATASQAVVDSKNAEMAPAASPISAATAGENLKSPKADVLITTDSSSPESSGLPVPDEKTIAPTAAFADGTLAAKLDGLMGSGEKTGKIAVLAGKFLPGSAVVASRGNDLSGRAEQIFTATGAGTADQGSPATVTASAASLGNSLAEDVRAQVLERAHDAITLHALSLGGAGTDSLQVVIKPGAGMQLSLELHQRGDGVEVQAVLQQGDFKHLNQQWPELQQRLEQRGIKLTPLVADGNSANGGNGEMFQQRKNQPENQPAGPVTEMSFAASSPGTFAGRVVRTAGLAGWETWA